MRRRCARWNPDRVSRNRHGCGGSSAGTGAGGKIAGAGRRSDSCQAVKPALTGITVLVTRPSPADQPLAQLIEQHGGTPICLPGVELVAACDDEPSLACLDQFTADDIAIFTSANAVRFALQRKPAAQWPASSALIAVGQRTADTLVDAGFENVLLPELVLSTCAYYSNRHHIQCQPAKSMNL